MKATIASLFAIGMIGSTTMTAVDNKDLSDIRALVQNGDYKQALQKHLWFHEESKQSPSMAGVRLSFALSDWLRLGHKYPPALDALKNIRDKNKALLQTGKGSFTNFHDLSAINRTLGEDAATVELFLQMDKQYHQLARRFYNVAEDLLIQNKHYELCSKYMGDPFSKYENLRHSREMKLNLTRTNPRLNNPRFIAHSNRSFTKSVVRLLEVLVAIDRKSEANEIQKRALAYYHSPEIEKAVKPVK